MKQPPQPVPGEPPEVTAAYQRQIELISSGPLATEQSLKPAMPLWDRLGTLDLNDN